MSRRADGYPFLSSMGVESDKVACLELILFPPIKVLPTEGRIDAAMVSKHPQHLEGSSDDKVILRSVASDISPRFFPLKQSLVNRVLISGIMQAWMMGWITT